MEQENLLWSVKRKHMKLGDHITRSLSQQSLISSLKLGDHHKNQATLFTVDDTAVGGGSRGGRGCIWPPRSYTCSYCKRNFRSAQALGGHMNIHRRDKALLKQVTLYPPLDHDQDHHHQCQVHHDDNTSRSKSSVSSNPSQLSYTRTSVTHLSPSHGSISGFSKVISASNHDKGENLSFKRCKKSVYHDHLTMLPLFFDEIKGSNLKRPSNLRANQAVEDLDLELRLGDPPNKVYK